MRKFILGLGSLVCLLAVPGLFVVGMLLISESPLIGLAVIFGGCSVCLALAVVFDYVGAQIESFDPLLPETKPSSSEKPPRRISDLAGTPWAKNARSRKPTAND